MLSPSVYEVLKSDHLLLDTLQYSTNYSTVEQRTENAWDAARGADDLADSGVRVHVTIPYNGILYCILYDA